MAVTGKTMVRTRTRRVYAIPIFCGIFSFFHWFIFFPLLWHFLVQHMAVTFWLYALIIFVMWLVVMAICIFCWWYDMKRIVPVSTALRDVNTSFSYQTTALYDSPSFQTKTSIIQPDINAKTKVTNESDKEIIHMRSIPLQPQNTPALYNLHTGRHSYDSGDVRHSSDSFQKVTTEQHVSSDVILVKKESNLKFKSISSSDSEKSSKATLSERSKEYEVFLSANSQKTVTREENHTVIAIVEESTHGKDIQLRTKYDHRATAQEPTKVILLSESDNDDELFQHIDMDIRLSDERISGQQSQTGETEHVKDVDTPNADKLSQNMPEFDDYLHLVSIETPLSPREIFFSDLIKQASETEQQSLKAKEEKGNRHSYCVGDITYNKLSCDDRSSVPLFLYSDEWKKDNKMQDQIPEQAVDSSDDNPEVDQATEDPCDEFGQDKPESYGTALSPVETRRKSKELDDLKMLTQLLIDEEKQGACAPEIVTRAGRDEGGVESGRPSVEELDSSYNPMFPKVKPLKLIEDNQSQSEGPTPKPISHVDEPIIEKSRAKPRHRESQSSIFGPPAAKKTTSSTSEYFIADVDGGKPTSVTSEVYLKVEDSGLVSKMCVRDNTIDSEAGKLSAVGKQDLKRDLSADKLEYKSEDDEVFEDIQSSISKLRRHK